MAAGEFQLIERFFADLGVARGDVRLGVGDDAALVSVEREGGLALCVDTLVAGVHFPVDAPADTVGHKALAVNLSDLAAMGASPAWALLSLTLPEPDESWVAEFARGFSHLARAFDMALVGGDTTQGPLSVSVQVVGYVDGRLAMRRDRARVGDLIYVSGTLGDAAAGLRLWQQGRHDDMALIERLHRPWPRVKLGQRLLGHVACAIDISDGLAADLGHILSRSGVGAVINVDDLPLSPQLRAVMAPDLGVELALAGGDDYELCFTAPPAMGEQLAALAGECGVALTPIGIVDAEPGLRLRRADGSAVSISRQGWQHFAHNGE